ncbi:hypothetical protein F5Y19DRAFT_347562 [Xylariaceae sp. FL1651]|nr:hypothetical protein F5Y19DRAFT_347562 [Xylariaceae sp. FL1651]
MLTDTDYCAIGTSKNLAIWNMVEPGSVIIAASIPNLRVFVLKNKANLKATFRLGSGTLQGTRGRSQEYDDIHLDKVQSTMKAISAGTDRRRGEVKAWITSKGDDGSEKSILHETLPALGIVQTSTFTVEYPDETHPTSNRGNT